MSRKPAKNPGTAATTTTTTVSGSLSSSRVEPVEVFCRLRPLFDQNHEDTCIRIVDDTTLMLQVPAEGSRNGQMKQLVCSFSHVFDDTTTQKQIYSQVALPLVNGLLRGRNGLLFTYGVTGSGKTYSMIGNQQEAGMLQFSLDTIFSSIGSSQMAPKFTFKPDKSNWFEIQNSMDALADRHKEQQQRSSSGVSSGRSNTLARQTQNEMNKLNSDDSHIVSVNRDNVYGVFISCVEIYNNYIYDLLDDSSSSNGTMDKEAKMLREDQRTGSVYIRNVNECEVRSVEEALELMQRAQKRRVVAFTDLNAESSRSHSIFTIRVCQASQIAVQVNGGTAASLHSVPIQVSQLSLVDLAGSERTKRTNNTGSRLREAGGINSSLMALRNCMEVLRENCISNSSAKKMVPYRDTKLTYLFKSYFDGYGKIRMVLCVNPSSVECDETINVLKFSELSRDVVVPVNEPRMPKSASINANMASCVKYSLEDLEKDGLVLLHQLQQNNYFSIMSENFPPMEITSPHDEQTLPNLVSYLEEYQRRKDAVVRELDLLKQKFYSKLRETSDETERLREERNEYKSRLETRERDQIKSDSKIKALEKIINSNGAVTLHRTPMQPLPPPPVPNSTTTTTTSNNVGSSGGAAGSHPTSNSGPFSSGSATSLNSETPMLNTPYRSSRIQHLTNTILRQTGTAQSPVVPTAQTPSRAVGSIINTAAYNRYQTPAGVNSKPPAAPQATPQQSNGVNQRDGVPVGNRRAQRRSKSVEMWLDHRPPTATKTDTVLQPKMPRKKSVSKLELNDAKKSTKYVLTHQSCDEHGEIRTNLIKGDIIQSPSGGANVIFTDVETLEVRQQETPKPLKRTSDMIVEDPNVIEDRCAIGIEGHAVRKIVKKTRM